MFNEVQGTNCFVNEGGKGQDGANEGQGQGWQFRVAILPTKDNLAKARTALNQLDSLSASDDHPTAKLFQIQDDDLSTWDGTIADASDRDQRGKELCVYMPYDDRIPGFVFTQDKIKHLMLGIWKVLQDNDVEISYMTPGQDEKEIDCDPSIITPFCYSAFKPCKTREGILLANHYNPNQHPDPLAGLYFSEADLKHKGITYNNAFSISHDRIRYMTDHYTKTVQTLNDTIQKLSDSSNRVDKNDIPFVRFWQQLEEAFESDQFNLEESPASKALLSNLQTDYDQPHKVLGLTFENGERRSILEKEKIEDLPSSRAEDETQDTLADTIFVIMANIRASLAVLQRQLLSLDWPGKKPSHTTVHNLIQAYPYELQSIHCQIIHLQHEAWAIEKERLRQARLLPDHAWMTAGKVGAIGLLIGATIGTALVLTGIFAPLGIGILGAVAFVAVMGAGTGILAGGVAGILAYHNNKQPADVQPPDESNPSARGDSTSSTCSALHAMQLANQPNSTMSMTAACTAAEQELRYSPIFFDQTEQTKQTPLNANRNSPVYLHI